MNLIKKIFQIDLRSLALFRVAMGAVLLCDLGVRALSLKAHYSDYGIAPRKLLVDGLLHDFRFSFHIFNGQVEFQVFMFVLAFFFALSYTLGYKTKKSAIISWILLLSLQNRNSMILNSGDVITRMMLFWSIFVPISRVYSIDSALKSENRIKNKDYTHFSLAGVFFLLQLCIMYWFSIFYKTTPFWIENFLAIYYALHIDQYAKPLSYFLRQYISLTKFMTVYTLIIEILGPFLAIFPFGKGWIKLVGVGLMINLHLGLFFTFNLGTFPWICIAAWLAFIPALFWEFIEKIFEKRLSEPTTVYADGDCNFCLKLVLFIKTFLIIPNIKLKIAQKNPMMKELQEKENSWLIETKEGTILKRFKAFTHLTSLSPLVFWVVPILRLSLINKIGDLTYRVVAANRSNFSFLTKYITNPYTYRRPGKITNSVLIVCFSFILLHLLSNLNIGIRLPSSVKNFGRAFSLMQHWNMFANPKKNDGWFVIRGELLNKKEVNVWTEEFGEVSYEKPKVVADQFPDNRWRKYLMKTMDGDKEKLSLFSKYLCRRWNDKFEKERHLRKFRIYFFTERTKTPGVEFKIKKKKLWTHRCDAR